jgi:hypothetical protein
MVGRLTVLALRAVLVLLLTGPVVVQALMVPLLAIDLRGMDADIEYVRTPLLEVIVLGIGTVEVVMVCVWRLVTMVRRGTVFSHAAFRYVRVVIGAVVAAACLVLGLAAFLAPGEAVALGVVLLVGGSALAILGVALVVLVLRMLLAQAVERDVAAARMRAELDEVI